MQNSFQSRPTSYKLVSLIEEKNKLKFGKEEIGHLVEKVDSLKVSLKQEKRLMQELTARVLQKRLIILLLRFVEKSQGAFV